MRRSLVPLVVLVMSIPALGGAATKQVSISENGTSFSPDRVRVGPGGDVRWSKGAGGLMHNVREDGGLFRSGEPTAGPIDFSATFSAGTFHYFCEIHGGESGGMDGVVKVPPRTRKAPAGPPFTVAWASSGSETGDRYDVQYRVAAGPWRFWHRDTSARRGTFGSKGEPKAVRSGTSYSFRARSGDGSAESRWSPKVSFRA